MFKKLENKIVKSRVLPGIVLISLGVVPVAIRLTLFKDKLSYLPFYGMALLITSFGIYVLIVGLKESKQKK